MCNEYLRKGGQHKQSAEREQQFKLMEWALRLAIVVVEYLLRKH